MVIYQSAPQKTMMVLEEISAHEECPIRINDCKEKVYSTESFSLLNL